MRVEGWGRGKGLESARVSVPIALSHCPSPSSRLFNHVTVSPLLLPHTHTGWSSCPRCPGRGRGCAPPGRRQTGRSGGTARAPLRWKVCARCVCSRERREGSCAVRRASCAMRANGVPRSFRLLPHKALCFLSLLLRVLSPRHGKGGRPGQAAAAAAAVEGVCLCEEAGAESAARESVARAGLESARLSLSLSPCRMPHGTSSGESRAGVRP